MENLKIIEVLMWIWFIGIAINLIKSIYNLLKLTNNISLHALTGWLCALIIFIMYALK